MEGERVRTRREINSTLSGCLVKFSRLKAAISDVVDAGVATPAAAAVATASAVFLHGISASCHHV